jgi:3-oxoadipate enol-lactonase
VLVLLHGFCESHVIFEDLLPALAAGGRVICPNMPGHGDVPWGKGWHSLDDAACWLRDLLDALKIDRCILVGHSLGGYIAAAFAELFPERLLGLGMLHSTSLHDPPERKTLRDKAIQLVQENGKEPFLRAFVQGLFHAPQAQWIVKMNAIGAQTETAAIIALTRIMRDRPDRSPAIKRLQVPVMYISGEYDTLVSPERNREELQNLPIALLHRIPEASHMGMFETPDKIVAAIASLREAST